MTVINMPAFCKYLINQEIEEKKVGLEDALTCCSVTDQRATDPIFTYLRGPELQDQLSELVNAMTQYEPTLLVPIPDPRYNTLDQEMREAYQSFKALFARLLPVVDFFFRAIQLQNGDAATLADTARDLAHRVIDLSPILTPQCIQFVGDLSVLYVETDVFYVRPPMYDRITYQGFRNFLNLNQPVPRRRWSLNSPFRATYLIKRVFGKPGIPFGSLATPFLFSELEEGLREQFFSQLRSKYASEVIGSVLCEVDRIFLAHLNLPEGSTLFFDTLQAIDPSYPLERFDLITHITQYKPPPSPELVRMFRLELCDIPRRAEEICKQRIEERILEFRGEKASIDPATLFADLKFRIIEQLKREFKSIQTKPTHRKALSKLRETVGKDHIDQCRKLQWVLYCSSELSREPDTISDEELDAFLRDRLDGVPTVLRTRLGIKNLLQTNPQAFETNLETYREDERLADEMRAMLLQEEAEEKTQSSVRASSKRSKQKKTQESRNSTTKQEAQSSSPQPKRSGGSKKPSGCVAEEPKEDGPWDTRRKKPSLKEQIIKIIDQGCVSGTPSTWTIDDRACKWARFHFDPQFIRTSGLFEDRWPLTGEFKYLTLDDRALHRQYVRHVAGVSLRPLLDFSAILKVYAKPGVHISNSTGEEQKILSFIGTLTTESADGASSSDSVQINVAIDQKNQGHPRIYHMVADPCETFLHILSPAPDYSSDGLSASEGPSQADSAAGQQPLPSPHIVYNSSDDSLTVTQNDLRGALVVKTTLFPLYSFRLVRRE